MTIGGNDKAPEPASLAWFVVQASSRAEFKIEEAVRELGHDAYCPAEIKFRRSPRSASTLKLAMLPGYLFIGLRPDRRGDMPFPKIHAIEGVIGILGSSGRPAQIAYQHAGDGFQIGVVREMEADGAFDHTRHAHLKSATRKVRRTVKSFSELASVLTQGDDQDDETG